MEFLLILAVAFVSIKLGENYGKPLGYRRSKAILNIKEITVQED